MKNKIQRRDFLKLLTLLPAAHFLPKADFNSQKSTPPNIIVLVYDAWSASNISLYGYPRQTTPNLEKLADKAIVYHHHYAGGYFTVPGTTALLTGMHPWYNYKDDKTLRQSHATLNMFASSPDYYRFAYTHNPFAENVLRPMIGAMDNFKPRKDLFYQLDLISGVFQNDEDIASVGWIRSMETNEDGFANSIFLSRIWSYFTNRISQRMHNTFPLGLPRFSNSFSFLLEDATDWLAQNIPTFSSPFLVYFHLLPPHKPYNTRIDFYQRFANDNYVSPKKPKNFLSENKRKGKVDKFRLHYDEYILYVDSEIDRLLSLINSSDNLNDTWVILTSDHGEMLERGIVGHPNPSFYEPIAKIPLLIFPPGLKNRMDIDTPTSAVDILPTITWIAENDTPTWTEGELLPPFNPSYPADKSIFMVDARLSNPGQPYSDASLMVRKGPYKLIYHFGSKDYYEGLQGGDSFELFDLQNDPDEMTNLASTQPELLNQLFEELKSKMREKKVI